MNKVIRKRDLRFERMNCNDTYDWTEFLRKICSKSTNELMLLPHILRFEKRLVFEKIGNDSTRGYKQILFINLTFASKGIACTFLKMSI